MNDMRYLINLVESVEDTPVEYRDFIIYPRTNRTRDEKAWKNAFGHSYASTKKTKVSDGYQIAFMQDGNRYWVDPKFAVASDNLTSAEVVHAGTTQDAKDAIDTMYQKIESGDLKFTYRA